MKRHILWLDCGGGLLVGSAMLILSGWLLPLYRMPALLYDLVAGTNLAYGCSSLFLALSPRRASRAVAALAMANGIWGMLCLALALWYMGQVTIFGLGHFVLEGGFVIWLGWSEWRDRHLLSASSR